jgi:hypothetical protein
MIIETKFDVGQEVFCFVIETKPDGCFMRQTGRYVVAGPFAIESITIYSSDRPAIYRLSNGCTPSEDRCFITEAAALAEIERGKAK